MQENETSSKIQSCLDSSIFIEAPSLFVLYKKDRFRRGQKGQFF